MFYIRQTRVLLLPMVFFKFNISPKMCLRCSEETVAHTPEEVGGRVEESEFKGQLSRVLVHPVAMAQVVQQAVDVTPTQTQCH